MGYLRLRQICLVAPALAPAEALITDLFGLRLCHKDDAVAKYGLENALWPVADRFIEVVAPIQENTAVGRFLDRNPDGAGYMLIFDCDDPAEREKAAASVGVRVAHRLSYPDYNGVQLHPKDCRACFLEFDHTEGGEALDGPYHPAGPDWTSAVKTDVTQRLREAVVVSPDPESLAEHWAAIFGVEPRSDGPEQIFEIDAQTIRIAPSGAGARETLDALVFEVSDPEAIRRRAAQYGLETDATGFRLAGVWIRLEAS